VTFLMAMMRSRSTRDPVDKAEMGGDAANIHDVIDIQYLLAFQMGCSFHDRSGDYKRWGFELFF